MITSKWIVKITIKILSLKYTLKMTHCNLKKLLVCEMTLIQT